MNIYLSLFLFGIIMSIAIYFQMRYEIESISLASILLIVLYAGGLIDYQFGVIGIVILFYSIYKGLKKKNDGNVE